MLRGEVKLKISEHWSQFHGELSKRAELKVMSSCREFVTYVEQGGTELFPLLF